MWVFVGRGYRAFSSSQNSPGTYRGEGLPLSNVSASSFKRPGWKAIFCTFADKPDASSACPVRVTCPWAGPPGWRRNRAGNLLQSAPELKHISNTVHTIRSEACQTPNVFWNKASTKQHDLSGVWFLSQVLFPWTPTPGQLTTKTWPPTWTI